MRTSKWNVKMTYSMSTLLLGTVAICSIAAVIGTRQTVIRLSNVQTDLRESVSALEDTIRKKENEAENRRTESEMCLRTLFLLERHPKRESVYSALNESQILAWRSLPSSVEGAALVVFADRHQGDGCTIVLLVEPGEQVKDVLIESGGFAIDGVPGDFERLIFSNPYRRYVVTSGGFKLATTSEEFWAILDEMHSKKATIDKD